MRIAFVLDLEAHTSKIPHAEAPLGPMSFISALRLRAGTAPTTSIGVRWSGRLCAQRFVGCLGWRSAPGAGGTASATQIRQNAL